MRHIVRFSVMLAFVSSILSIPASAQADCHATPPNRPLPSTPGEAHVDDLINQALDAQQHQRRADAKKLYLVALDEVQRLPDSLAMERQILWLFSAVDPEQGIAMAKRVVAMDQKALGPQDPQIAVDLSQLAIRYEQVDKSKAAKLYDEAVKAAESTTDMDCAQRVGLLENAASFYSIEKRYPEAEALSRQAMYSAVNLPPATGLGLMGARNKLAGVLSSEGKNEEAEQLISTPFAPSSLRESSPLNPDLTGPLSDLTLANLYKAQGRQQEAELLYRRAISGLEGVPPRLGLAALASALDGLSEICHAQERNSEAEELLLRALDLKEKNAGPQMLATTRMLGSPSLENFYREEGRLSEMEQIYQQIIQIQEKYLDPQDDAILNTFLAAASLYVDEKKPEESLPLYRRALQFCEQNPKEDNSMLLSILYSYSLALDASGHPTEANEIRVRRESIRRKTPSKK